MEKTGRGASSSIPLSPRVNEDNRGPEHVSQQRRVSQGRAIHVPRRRRRIRPFQYIRIIRPLVRALVTPAPARHGAPPLRDRVPPRQLGIGLGAQ